MMRKILSILFLVFSCSMASAQVNSLDEEGKGLRGYDPVEYLDSRAIVSGQEEFHFTYKGARYHFRDIRNKVTFVKNKDRYVPQYGGFSADGILRGQRSAGLPEYFLVHDEKLFMFDSQEALNGWKEDTAGKVARADQRWEEIITSEQQQSPPEE